MKDETLNNVKVERQAVVIIHGIGEQRPMDTLRSFAKGIHKCLSATDLTEQNTVLRSKTDNISDIFETRMMSLSGTHNRPITDFYEFYWAQNMRDTTFMNTARWLLHLIFSPRAKIPDRLAGLWKTLWTIFITAVILCAGLLYFVGPYRIKTIFAPALALPLVAVFLHLVENHASSVFLSTAGDAARYFTPVPDNIEQRSLIRQQGLRFLKKLHDQDGKIKYDRIILVGHSLGTAIAYDLLRLLWTDYNTGFDKNPKVPKSLIDSVDVACKELNKYSTKEEIRNYQNLQHALWRQQREMGNKWLITDFVTLGAAICHLDYFLVSRIPFERMKTEREFPVCPPVLDERKKSISFEDETYTVNIAGVPQKRTVRLLHDAALFAVIRWENIYFSSDFVGGDVRRLFGYGIRDVSIVRKSFWFLPGGHTNYWEENALESLNEIKKALRLRYDDSPQQT